MKAALREPMKAELREAHKYSSKNKEFLVASDLAGCFYCCSIFKASEVQKWVDRHGKTALCPYCNIDSVIGDKSHEITLDFLKEMFDAWFGK